jgi:hypothetical protein
MNDPPEWQLNLIEVVRGAELCFSNGLKIPCLILIYSGIDIAGSMVEVDGKASGAAFKKWVNEYLSKACPLPCTPAELYGARCGLVHTMRVDSRLSSRGEAREIGYSWGTMINTTLIRVRQ